MMRGLAISLAVTMAAVSGSAHAGVVDFSTMQLNGTGISATATTLHLNDGVGGEATSAFLPVAVASNSTFTSSFKLTLTGNPNNPNCCNSPIADGVTFIIQNDPAGAGALGGGGGGVGANGITKSVGVGFQSWDNNRFSIFQDGNIGGGPIHNFNLGDQNDVVLVTLSYAGHILNVNANNLSTGTSISDSLNIDLGTLGPSVYFGFTGGTGLGYAYQDVQSWDLNIGAGGVPEPATWAMLIMGFGLIGTSVRRRRLARV